MHRLDAGTNQVTTFMGESDLAPVDLKVDDSGDLLLLSRGADSVQRITYSSRP